MSGISYPPPKRYIAGTFNQSDWLYTLQKLQGLANIGTGNQIFKLIDNGIGDLRTLKSPYMTLTTDPNEISIASDGVLKMADGTNSAPSYSFNNEQKTGMHLSGTNIHFVRNGSDKIKIQSNELIFNNIDYVISVGNFVSQKIGSVLAPTFNYVDGATNQGMFFKASTFEPSITHGSSVVSEYGSGKITFYKSLFNDYQPYRTYRANATTTLVTGSAVLLDYALDVTAQKSQGTIINRTATGTYTLGEIGVYLVIYTFSTTSVSAGEQMMFCWANLNNNTTGAGTRYGEMVLQRDANSLGQQGSFFIKTTAISDYVSIFGYRGGGTTGNFPANTTDNNFIQIIKVF